MRKNETELLNNIQKAKPTNDLLLQTAKTPQQNFLLTFAAIYFIRSGHIMPTLQKLLTAQNGTFSQNMLTFHYMKHCLKNDMPLDNQQFRVYEMVCSWMKKVDKLKKNQNPRLLPSVLQSQPGKLPLNHYAQLIVYFSCISRDLITFLKSPAKLSADDLLQLFGVLLPRLHYNIILPHDETKGKETTFNDILFINEQIDYFVRTCSPYRVLVRKMFRVLLKLQLKSSQLRQLVELACRYYLLFCHNKNQKTEELFLQTFEKASEPVRFSLSNELVLFFKVARKLGETNLQKQVREKWAWVDSLVQQFKVTMVGHNKEEVSPYNPLGVQQVINVGAGKMNLRTIQIYHQNSLFYFQLGIESRDINMRVYYLGDFESKVEVRKLLLTEQKLNDTVKSAFVATKRGLYQVELDNSYSWVYAKNIKFQYVILAPHNHKSDSVWVDQLLEASFQVQDQEESQSSEEEKEEEKKQEQSNHHVQNKQNAQAKVPTIEVIQQKQLPSKPKKFDTKKDEIVVNANSKSKNDRSLKVEWAQANLSLIDSIFSLLVSSADHSYEFETDREESIAKKLQGCIEAEQQLQWILNGEARQWLHKHGYSLGSKNNALLLLLPGGKKTQKRNKLSEVFKYRS